MCSSLAESTLAKNNYTFEFHHVFHKFNNHFSRSYNCLAAETFFDFCYVRWVLPFCIRVPYFVHACGLINSDLVFCPAVTCHCPFSLTATAWQQRKCTLCSSEDNLGWLQSRPTKRDKTGTQWHAICSGCRKQLWRDYTKLEEFPCQSYHDINSTFPPWLHDWLKLGDSPKSAKRKTDGLLMEQ